MFSLIAAATLISAQAPTVQPPAPPSPAAALRALPNCTGFKWVALPGVSDRAAITIPVTIGGESYDFQLDTGSNVSMAYKGLAEKLRAEGNYYRASALSLGGKTLPGQSLLINREMEGGEIAGTIGLDALLGRIAIIDYPTQRFCLLDDVDAPGAVSKADWVSGTLRNGKFFVPVTIGDFASDDLFFDTGASLTPISVDLKNWTKLTGIIDSAKAPRKLTGPAWGASVTLLGAKSSAPLRIGKTELVNSVIFTRQETERDFATYPFRVTGLIGNSAVWDRIVIFDLTPRMNFGLLGE